VKESNVIGLCGRETGSYDLTELLRNGARTLIAQALEAELAELLERFKGCQDWRKVTPWWYATAISRSGRFLTCMRPVTMKVPKISSRNGESKSFHSPPVPPYVRKAAGLEAALPVAVSERDFHRRDALSAGGTGGS